MTPNEVLKKLFDSDFPLPSHENDIFIDDGIIIDYENQIGLWKKINFEFKRRYFREGALRFSPDFSRMFFSYEYSFKHQMLESCVYMSVFVRERKESISITHEGDVEKFINIL